MVNKSDEFDEADALLSAVILDEPAVFNDLIKKGININAQDETGMTALIACAEFDNVELIEVLLANGVDVNAKNNEGDTALDYARYYCQPETQSLLELHGAIGAEGTSSIQRRMDGYYELMYTYLDDRMFILEIGRIESIDSTIGDHDNKTWAVVTRRNVFSHPVFRCDSFETKNEAVSYLKKVAPETPRVSLGGAHPSPIPSWDEFQNWLESIGLERMPY